MKYRCVKKSKRYRTTYIIGEVYEVTPIGDHLYWTFHEGVVCVRWILNKQELNEMFVPIREDNLNLLLK